MKKTNFDLIVKKIKGDLPKLAKTLIAKSPTKTKEFLKSPDDPKQHKPKWHEFGIITHSVKMFDFLKKGEHLNYFKKNAQKKNIQNYLSDEIDSIKRIDLLQITALWHDIGKFAGRKMNKSGNWGYEGHENISSQIVEKNHLLLRYGLTRKQENYIVKTIRHHFVLGKIRKIVRNSNNNPRGLNLTPFLSKIKNRHCKYYPEICILFLADTISKGKTIDQIKQWKLNEKIFREAISLIEK